MLRKVRKWLLKKLYNLFIYKIIIIDKEVINKVKTRTFCILKLNSDKGEIVFHFKEDRRRNKNYFLRTFIVDLELPNELAKKESIINEKVLIVIKIVLGRIDYEIMAELLLEKYISKFIEIAKKEESR